MQFVLLWSTKLLIYTVYAVLLQNMFHFSSSIYSLGKNMTFWYSPCLKSSHLGVLLLLQQYCTEFVNSFFLFFMAAWLWYMDVPFTKHNTQYSWISASATILFVHFPVPWQTQFIYWWHCYTGMHQSAYFVHCCFTCIPVQYR